MPTFRVEDARPWMIYSNVNRLPSEVESAWRTAFAPEFADLQAACGNLRRAYVATTVQLAAEQAMKDASDYLQGKSILLDDDHAVYKPGGAGHNSSARTLRVDTTPRQDTVTLDDATQVVVVPTIFIRVGPA